MDMNKPRKRSFSSSGLPQGLDKVRKRKKKPSLSKLKGKSSAPTEEDQAPALLGLPEPANTKSHKRGKTADEQKHNVDVLVESANGPKQGTVTHPVRQELSTHPPNGHQQKPPKKKPKLPGTTPETRQAGVARPGNAVGKPIARVQQHNMEAKPELGTGASLSKKQRKKRNKAEMAARLSGQLAEPDVTLKQERIENFRMNWNDIEQSAAHYLETKCIDWDLITSEQRQHLEERYIGSPFFMMDAESTSALNGEATNGDDGSLSSSQSDSSDELDESPARSETSTTIAGAHRLVERSDPKRFSPQVRETGSTHNAHQQPPHISVPNSRPCSQQPREGPPGPSGLTGGGVLKTSLERKVPGVPTTNLNDDTLADTQAKFRRLIAALNQGKDDSSSEDSSSSSESDSDDEPAAKLAVKGSISESFADRMPVVSTGGRPDKTDSASEISEDEEEIESASVAAKQDRQAAPEALVPAATNSELDSETTDTQNEHTAPSNTTATSYDLPIAAADPSESSSSLEESSDEEDAEAAIQSQAASTTTMTQNKETSCDNDSDEDIENQGVDVDPVPYISAHASAAEVSNPEHDDDKSAMSGVAGESSYASSDSSEDEAIAGQKSPSVQDVTEADEALPAHPSELANEDGGESGDGIHPGDSTEEADDAPGFILNEDGEIVLGPGSSVADNATPGVEETGHSRGQARPEDEDEEMLESVASAKANDENVNNKVESSSGIDSEEHMHDSEIDDKVVNNEEGGTHEEETDDEAPLYGKAHTAKDYHEGSRSEQSEDVDIDAEADARALDATDALATSGSPAVVPHGSKKVDADVEDSSSDSLSSSDENDSVDDVLAAKSTRGEEQPITVVQSAEESNQTQLTASQRQEAAGTRNASSRKLKTANVVIKRIRLSQDLNQDLGGTKSGLSQDLPVQASNDTDGVDASPQCTPAFMEVDSQEAIDLIDSVSQSVFADTRPLPEGEDSNTEPSKIRTEARLMTASGRNAHEQSTVKQASSNVQLQPNAGESTPPRKIAKGSLPEQESSNSDSDISEGGEEDVHPDTKTPSAKGKTRDRASMAVALPSGLRKAIAMATGTPQSTPSKRRKMTGNTSAHFSTPTRTKPLPQTRAASSADLWVKREKPQRHSPDRADRNCLTSSTSQSFPQQKSPAKKTGTISEHFIADRVDLYNTTAGLRRKVPAGQSVNPCPPLDSPTFGIIQERTCHEPFWLLIATVLLNKTTGRQAAPAFWKIRVKWPSPAELAAADYDSLFDMIKHLGFQVQRTKRLKTLAAAWEASPPIAGKRYRTLHYPSKGNGKEYKPAQIVNEDADDCAGALEIAHIPGCGAYAYDSWRIFCRDVLRGVATDYLGSNATAKNFEPEWKRVLPDDKELRACLRWMWLKERYVWDPLTGTKRAATDEEIEKAKNGDMDFQDVIEAKFAAQAAGQNVSSPDKAVRGDEVMPETENLVLASSAASVDNSFAHIDIPDAGPEVIDNGSDWALKHSQVSAKDDEDIVGVLAKPKAPKPRVRKAQVQIPRQALPEVVVKPTTRTNRPRSPSVDIGELKSSPVVRQMSEKDKVSRRKVAGPAFGSDGLV